MASYGRYFICLFAESGVRAVGSRRPRARFGIAERFASGATPSNETRARARHFLDVGRCDGQLSHSDG
jgi:hypothetical protein